MGSVKPYVIDTDRPTKGPWRETPWGDRYASVTMADGRKFHVSVEKDKRVRIPYKPRPHNYGWTYIGSVKDANGRCLVADKVSGSIGVRGLLKMAYLIPDERRFYTPLPGGTSTGDRNFSHCTVCGTLFENQNEHLTECPAHRKEQS